LLSVAPAIICKGVKIPIVIAYPANTVELPEAIKVQPARASPTLAIGLPFTNTVELPPEIAATCSRHGFPGRRWGVLRSPRPAAGKELTNTVELPWAMVNPLQCGTP